MSRIQEFFFSPSRAIDKVYDTFTKDSKIRTATYYIAPDLTVKITRSHVPDKRSRGETFHLTVGKPNFAERKFIKLCYKAGQSFPVRKVQLKFWPKPKKGIK